MNTRHVRLLDRSGAAWAEAQVVDQGDHFGGTVVLHAAPAPLRALFEEFEEVVNGQMFALLDDVQERIDSLVTRVEFDDHFEAPVADLQVFPSRGELSFRLDALPSGMPASSAPRVQGAPGD